MIIFNPTWEQAVFAAAAVGAASAALLYRGTSLARRERGGPGGSSPQGSTEHNDETQNRTARRLTGAGRFARESALVLALFALWQFAGTFSVMGPRGALGRGRWLWDVERAMRLPSEAWLQKLTLPYPDLVQAFNLYYDILHFPVLIAGLIWLFVRHRERYGQFRITLVAFTGLCLLIQLIPVAPPRMLSGIGMVDSAAVYGQSVYSSSGGFEADQLSAMPSVHVGWAILVAIAVIGVASPRWRWLVVLYPVMTTLAVVVTANHYWLDGVAAAIVLVAVLAVQAAVARLLAARARRAGTQAEPREPLSPLAGTMTRSGGG